MTMQFGVWLPQAWNGDFRESKDPVEAFETMTHIAHTADEAGFTSAWLIDHLHTLPQPSQEVAFEAWTTTAALARDTRRVRVGQLVTCNGYRNPALLAKMASSVDVLSHGRLNFGIGAGWTEHEYLAYGYEYADACNVRGDLETIQHKFDVIRQHCEVVGREYESIHRTSTMYCSIADTDEQARGPNS